MSLLTSRAKCCLKRTPKYRVSGNCVTALLEQFPIFIYLLSVAISLFSRFSVATTNLLNRSVFSISVNDVDSDFSLRPEDSEAEEGNDEWWVVLQVGIL